MDGPGQPSLGKGFSGVMKRHNFHGQGASHGNHKKHRAPGSIGASAFPARVFKGMRMPGQMGNKRRTQKGLEIADIDVEQAIEAINAVRRMRKEGLEGYLTIGLYSDGRPGEIFVKMAKEGSTICGMGSATDQSTSSSGTAISKICSP